MSSRVKYPFHVRHNGVDYSPGAPIEVENPEWHVSHGAVEVVDTSVKSAPQPTPAHSPAPAKPSRRKAAK